MTKSNNTLMVLIVIVVLVTVVLTWNYMETGSVIKLPWQKEVSQKTQPTAIGGVVSINLVQPGETNG